MSRNLRPNSSECATHPVTCLTHAPAYLAGTSPGQELGDTDHVTMSPLRRDRTERPSIKAILSLYSTCGEINL
jgi:hypothetical protein